MSIEDLILQRSKNCEVLSSPLRSFIAAFIAGKGEAVWSDLKAAIEKSGPINPNTLSFHIGVLMDAGFVDKMSIEHQPRYRIKDSKLLEIERLVGKDIIQKISEEY